VPFHSTSEYLGLPRSESAWIVEDVVPEGGTTLIYGKPKEGKSFAALQMASAIATPGSDSWLGFPVTQHGPCVYLQVDTPRSIWVERVETMISKGYKFDGVHWADAMDTPYPFNITAEGYAWLKDNVAPLNAKVVFIDVLREIHGGDENDSAAMRAVISALRSACPTSALVMVNHARKENPLSGPGDLMDDSRGSSYTTGRMDCVVRVSKSRLQLKGRTTGEVEMAISRDGQGCLVLVDAFHQRAMDMIMKAKGESERELAKRLHAEFEKTKSYEACRSHVRRLLVGLKKKG